jgi:hypothetical protein
LPSRSVNAIRQGSACTVARSGPDLTTPSAAALAGKAATARPAAKNALARLPRDPTGRS